MTIRQLLGGTAAALVLAAGMESAGADSHMMKAPWGGPADTGYAAVLWKALEANRLAGPDAIHGTPYEGVEPHGLVLDTLDTEIPVDGHVGDVIVKRNYGPKGVATQDVANDPAKHLKAVTVMFRRAAGYDPENKNWFWVKYGPDGKVLTNPDGVKLAGKVGKGTDKACIGCHKNAPGDDLVWNNDRIK